MEVIRLSTDLKAYLDCSPQKVLTVHSVFPGAINLVDQENNLVTLLVALKDNGPLPETRDEEAHLGKKKNIGPMSAVVTMSHGELQSVCTGDEVLTDGVGLNFLGCGWTLNLAGARLWEVGALLETGPFLDTAFLLDTGAEIAVDVNDLNVQLDALRNIRKVIIQEEASIGIGALVRQFDFEHLDNWILPKIEPVNVYCTFISEPLTRLLEALICKDFELFLALLPRVIGFGPGLTPSTDDFLAGVMISIYYDAAVCGTDLEDKKKLLWRMYQEAIGRTTLVSQNMLKHVALGYVSEDHRTLVHGLFFRSSDCMESLAKTVAKHGASSGVDFLFGFYCMNKIRVTQGVKETLTHG